MIHLNKEQIKQLKDYLSFYDFEKLESINRRDYRIDFKNKIKDTVYSDLRLGGDKAAYRMKERAVISLINSIISSLSEDDCVLLNYQDSWIINKKLSKRLVIVLKQNNVKNRYTKAFIVPKDSEIIQLFMKSVLKYNSFVGFAFPKEKTVITLTDHMDFFIGCESNDMVQKVQNTLNEYNESYRRRGNMRAVFEMKKYEKHLL